MDTKTLEYIVTVADEGSVARAADKFFISHQALYRHIKNIDEEVGAAIFRKTALGIQPTKAGELFLAGARKILEVEKDLNTRLAVMRHRQNKIINLSIDSHTQNVFFKQIAPAFQREYPDYTLETEISNAPESQKKLYARTVDLSLFETQDTNIPGLICTPLTYMEFLPIFPIDFDGPADIDGIRQFLSRGLFIMLHQKDSTLRLLEEKTLNSEGIYPKHILGGVTQNIISHTIRGDTCGIIPALACTPEVRMRLKIGVPIFSSRSILAYQKTIDSDPGINRLIQIITEIMTNSKQ